MENKNTTRSDQEQVGEHLKKLAPDLQQTVAGLNWWSGDAIKAKPVFPSSDLKPCTPEVRSGAPGRHFGCFKNMELRRPRNGLPGYFA